MGQADQGLKTGRQRYQAVPRVLIFLRNGSDVLLLKGAPDKRIWANLYNGVGGHIEVDEDVLSAARREVREETGVYVDVLNLKAIVNIDAGDDKLGILMFAFVGRINSKLVFASQEGELHWIPINDLAEYELVEDLRWLLPRIIEGPDEAGPLFLHYSYSSDDQLIIHQADH